MLTGTTNTYEALLTVAMYWQGSKEISLNYEVYVHKRDERSLTASNSSLCDANCHLVIGLKLLQLFKESMAEVLTTPGIQCIVSLLEAYKQLSFNCLMKVIYSCTTNTGWPHKSTSSPPPTPWSRLMFVMEYKTFPREYGLGVSIRTFLTLISKLGV